MLYDTERSVRMTRKKKPRAILQPLYKWKCSNCNHYQLEPFWPVELNAEERTDMIRTLKLSPGEVAPGKLHRAPVRVECEQCATSYRTRVEFEGL